VAPTTEPKPIPDAYRRVTPCLVVQGGVKALEFYAAVFGATERMRLTPALPPTRSNSGWPRASR
jgi:uncharacterized glyoxalase superfamily protein PhnB